MTTTRRDFLAAAGAIGAVAPFVKASDKAGTKNPVLGEGEHQYECIHDWGQLPSNIKYGNTHSVCEDAQGHIYIHHTVHKTSESLDSVVVFDDKGKFVRSWGPMFHGGAHGMHLSKEGKTEYLYFCDEKHGIITKRTLKGEEIWTMGYPQDSPIYQKGPGSTGPGGAAGLNYRPTNFAIAPNGDFWVGDGYGSYYMFHYSVASPTAFPKLVNVFGGPAPIAAAGAGRGAGGGRGPGGPPAGGAPAGGPPADGQQAAAGAPGGGGARGGGGRAARPPAPIDQMNNPHGNMVDRRDPNNLVLLVADRGNNRIVRYTLDDKPIDIVGGTRQPCHFHEFKGNIVVPDLSGPVHILDKDNKVLVSMGAAKPDGPKNPPRTTEDRSSFVPGQFVNPHGAIFDRNGNIFVAEWVEIGRVTKLRKV
ncbi:MAG TPA: twin-arginine translocation signal domain-containing protein [Bryobacteraceae bacterium]|nr:twin-arginine translocation signal domain-containing protein [Bryobacteraceae bacterium]